MIQAAIKDELIVFFFTFLNQNITVTLKKITEIVPVQLNESITKKYKITIT